MALKEFRDGPKTGHPFQVICYGFFANLCLFSRYKLKFYEVILHNVK